MKISTENGASSWLSTLPIEEHGFALHKGAFRDALCFRYGWQPTHLPAHCVCGKAGRLFVQEVTRLFTAYAENSALESISLKAAMIMPTLLLQKPHQRSKPKEFSSHLGRRLKLWLEGNLEELLNESRTIQQRTCRIHQNSNQPPQEIARIFAKLMMQGKVKKALRLIDSESKGGPLQLNDRVEPEMPETVQDVLTKKHPPKQHPKPSAIITS